jgi:predicted  nucleic acid-binding Zn-ribbon protein
MNKSGGKGESSDRKEEREKARLNPEFEGIGRQFVQTHYRRRSIQLEQKHAANRVAFLQKEHETTQKRLEQKQADLDRLMAVIGRKQAD